MNSAANEAALENVINAAFACVARVHRTLSFQNPASELSRFNAWPVHQVFKASPDLSAVLQQACLLFDQSKGMFDPCAGAEGSLADLDVNDEPLISIVKRRPLQINLSGIAKGYAVDCAVASLVDAGCAQGWVNAGGDLRSFGDRPMRVQVRDPVHLHTMHELPSLLHNALATSAHYGHDQALIYDPRCKEKALLNSTSKKAHPYGKSWSVIAPSCMLADALTKVLAISGWVDHPLLNQYGAQAFIH
jgi:FAD:protein FMN transferase